LIEDSNLKVLKAAMCCSPVWCWKDTWHYL